ncbi:hypothetical protein [Jiella avicenniae]|uniref:PD-(D/E)XK nuclease superfamily protein n=1 Tax=Jiella avicenniae TaxID=2907202 RepID=A0A9X1T5Q0_9HYPH|nr:hypothetical protein [Jiella avicenniae]MCE7028450.1 hypothetical protein [Jiella avicenniae]
MVALPSTAISPTIAAIDAHYEAHQDTKHNQRLTGRMLAAECDRRIWLEFRWAAEPASFPGYIVRANLRRDDAIQDVVQALISLRISVPDLVVDLVDRKTLREFQITAIDGHFVQKVHGMISGLIEAPKRVHLLYTDRQREKAFNQIRKMGLAEAAPARMPAIQIGMHFFGLERAFYVVENKDSNELHGERIRYDAAHCYALMARADRVVEASRPLPKISDEPDHWICKRCPSHPVCHGGAFALRNCRTCLHSTPVPGGDAKWWCERDGRELSIDDQRAGCGKHLFLPDLVPGDQVDAAEDGSSVTYRMPDGSEWIDGRAA